MSHLIRVLQARSQVGVGGGVQEGGQEGLRVLMEPHPSRPASRTRSWP